MSVFEEAMGLGLNLVAMDILLITRTKQEVTPSLGGQQDRAQAVDPDGGHIAPAPTYVAYEELLS